MGQQGGHLTQSKAGEVREAFSILSCVARHEEEAGGVGDLLGRVKSKC